MNQLKIFKIKMGRWYAEVAKIVKLADIVIQRSQAVLPGITLKSL